MRQLGSYATTRVFTVAGQMCLAMVHLSPPSAIVSVAQCIPCILVFAIGSSAFGVAIGVVLSVLWALVSAKALDSAGGLFGTGWIRHIIISSAIFVLGGTYDAGNAIEDSM